MKNFLRFLCSPVLLLPSLSFSADSLPPPVFSHPAGTFVEPFELIMSSGDGTTIHYTTDGGTPTSASPQFDEAAPPVISGARQIRARTYNADGDSSVSVTKMYNQLGGDVANFNSNLPLVIVNEHDETMLSRCQHIPPRFETICDRTLVHFSVIDVEDDGRARLLTDNLHVHGRSESNYRGNSSLTFPKRQFGIRLLDEEDENRNEPVLGMPSENNWILHAPYDDKVMIRNAVAFRLNRDMGHYSPRTRFVELFKHDGRGNITQEHYHGVYMLVERIKWDNNRVDIAKLSNDDNQEPEITGGYILNHDTGPRGPDVWSSHRNTGFRLVRPLSHDITGQQRNWISNYLGKLEEALFGDNFTDPEDGYAAWLDPDTFIDQHLITEGLKEIDGYRKSTYLYKDRDSRIKMGPLWDWNLSMGNTSVGNLDYGCETWGWYYDDLLANNPASFYLNGWYTRLFEDPEFRERYNERWWELRRGPLSNENILNVIHEYVEKLEEAQQRNYERWPILGQWVMFNCVAYDTYEEEVDYMISWTRERLHWVDRQLGPRPSGFSDPQLRFFWSFDDELPNNTPFETLKAGYSLVEKARIRYYSALEGYPFDENHPDWRRASMERRNRPTDLNYFPKGNNGKAFKEEDMRALQVKQPFTGDAGENTMIFELPTTDLGGVVFRFAAMDESAADALLIDYSTSPGEPEWTTDGLPGDEHTLGQEYHVYELDFRDIPEVDDNPHFRIRIRFAGEDMTADHGGRVTFNNFSLETFSTSAFPGNGGGDIPEEVELGQNYPNPFNPETSITYSIPRDMNVELSIYDVTGRKIRTLVSGRQEAGEHTYVFDASGLASGIYIYELRAGSSKSSRTMTFIK